MMTGDRTLWKQRVLERCKTIIAEKLADRQAALQELIDSTANETKSTAGDKYETGRAMLHIEQDNVRRQIAEIKAQKAVLDAIIDGGPAGKITGPGSLVETSAGLYFISIALGKLLVDGEPVIALSAQSPLGALLVRHTVGDSISINGQAMLIIDVS